MKKRGMFVATWTLGVSMMTLFGSPVLAEDAVPQQAGVQDTSKETDALLNIKIKNAPVLGDVEVKALSGDQDGNDNLAEIKTKDTAIVGDAHVGVADRHVSANEAGDTRVDEGLVEVNTKDTALLGDVHAGVLDHHEAVDSQGGKRFDAGVLQLNTAGTALLNDVNLGILDRHTEESSAPKSSSSLESAANATLGSLPLLGDVHLGVLESIYRADSDGVKGQDHAVQLLVTDGILGNINLTVLERETALPAVPPSEGEAPPQPGTPGDDGAAPKPESPSGNNGSTTNPEKPAGTGSGSVPENEGNTSTDSPNGENVEGNGNPKPGIPVEDQGNGTVDPTVPADVIVNGGPGSFMPNGEPAVESPVDQNESVIQEAILPGGMPWVQDLDSLAYDKKTAGAAWQRDLVQSADRSAGESVWTNANWADKTDDSSAVGKLPNTGGYQYALYLLALLLMGSGYAIKRFPKQG